MNARSGVILGLGLCLKANIIEHSLKSGYDLE